MQRLSQTFWSWTRPNTQFIELPSEDKAAESGDSPSAWRHCAVRNMWAENDLGPGAPPCLSSFTEPAENKIYTMYHGTTRAAAENIMRSGFQPSKGGMLGRGVYLSRDLQKASRYPICLPDHEKVILRVRVNVGRVKKIDYQGHPMQKSWHDYGYDTAWCPPKCGMVSSGLEEDCVWDPQRIAVIDRIYPQQASFGACYDHY